LLSIIVDVGLVSLVSLGGLGVALDVSISTNIGVANGVGLSISTPMTVPTGIGVGIDGLLTRLPLGTLDRRSISVVYGVVCRVSDFLLGHVVVLGVRDTDVCLVVL
jgi:hypothetical protein